MNEDQKSDQTQTLFNPVAIIALLLIIGIFILFLAAMLGMDNGVLRSMGQFEFARGLITYLFAVVTIGTAIVLVVSVLTSPSEASEEMEKRFQRGKEVLSLLLGLFGTIVGFYFGSLRGGENVQSIGLHLTPPLLSQEKVISGELIKITAAVSGGTPPYLFGSAIDKNNDIKFNQPVDKNGWISQEIVVPTVQEHKNLDVLIGVKDSTGSTQTTSANIEIEPKPANP
jgi:uncharacterized membrane protein